MRINRKTLLFLVFITAIFLRLMMSLHYFDISNDKIHQVAAAKRLVDGKGYTVPSVDPLHLDQVTDKPMILWPPLYSVALAGLMRFDINTSDAVFLLESINNIVFLILIYQVCLVLNFPFWLSMLVLLFRATEINEMIISATATDYMALNLWLGAILAAISFLKKPKAITAFLFILLNALGPWLRYASIPLVVVLPFFVLILGFRKKDKGIQQMALLSGIFAIASTALLMYYNHSRSGSFFFVRETTKGFFPENLLYLPPIAWTSIVNTNFPLTQISLRTGIYYGDLNIALKISSALILVLLFFPFFKRSNWRSFLKNPNYFFVLGGSLALATLGSLALLSITRSREYKAHWPWTYIEDNRYMLVITTMLMFYLLYKFIVERKNHWLGYCLVFLMTAETAHGVWVLSTKPTNLPGETSFNSSTPLTKDLLLKRNAEAVKDKTELIVIDEDYDLRGFAVLQNIHILDDPQDLNRTVFKSTKNRRLFFRLYPVHQNFYKNFFSQPGVREIARLEKAVFYELDIPR